jgi:Flp pilus assembly protein TadG
MNRDRPSAPHDRCARGNVTAAFIICGIVLIGFVGLAVDFGRLQVARSQLQAATDAAALHAWNEFKKDRRAVIASSAARSSFDENVFDGADIRLSNRRFDERVTTQLVRFDKTTQSFVTTNANQAQAVRVTGRGRVPLMFLGVIADDDKLLTVTSIVGEGSSVEPGRSTTVDVHAEANPWLAGMPQGTPAYGDYNDIPGRNSPVLVEFNGSGVVPGRTLRFTDISGSTYPGEWSDAKIAMLNGGWAAAGLSGWMTDAEAHNGMSGLTAPTHGLMGVFLDQAVPQGKTPPGNLDFSSLSQLNQTLLKPQVRQPFFIGNGLTPNGELRKVVVPDNASRLYLGIVDQRGRWTFNIGSIRATITEESESSAILD